MDTSSEQSQVGKPEIVFAKFTAPGQESQKDRDDLKKYPIRWLQLFLFCFLEVANALFWVSFAPIFDITSNYFGGNEAYGSPTAVNMFANIFLIGYPVGTIVASISMKRNGLKKSLCISGFLTLCGGLVRVFAAMYHDTLGNGATYYLMLLGQSLASIAQPFLLNMPPVIASTWFPVYERDTTMTIGALCSPIGNAIGSVLPVLFVTQTSSRDEQGRKSFEVHGMLQSMLVQFYICAVAFILVIAFTQDAPPSAPSKSTKMKLSIVNDQTFAQSWELFVEETKRLFSDRDYVLLFSSFSISQGFFCAVMTLVFQIIEPFGYTNADAGTFGAVLIVCGVFGSGLICSYMERCKNYRSILRYSNVLYTISSVWMLCMIFAHNYWPLLLSFCAVGFFMCPLVPISISNAAECTYPVAEELSVGYMFIGSNMLGLVFAFVLQFLLTLDALGPPPLLPSTLFYMVALLTQNMLLFFYDGQYKRLKHDEGKSVNDQQNPLITCALHQ